MAEFGGILTTVADMPHRDIALSIQYALSFSPKSMAAILTTCGELQERVIAGIVPTELVFLIMKDALGLKGDVLKMFSSIGCAVELGTHGANAVLRETRLIGGAFDCKKNHMRSFDMAIALIKEEETTQDLETLQCFKQLNIGQRAVLITGIAALTMLTFGCKKGPSAAAAAPPSSSSSSSSVMVDATMMVNYDESTRSCCKKSRKSVGKSEQFMAMAKALFGDSKFKTFQADWKRVRARNGTLKKGCPDCDTELFLLQYKHGKYRVNQNFIGAQESGTIYSPNTFVNCVNFILENDVMPKVLHILRVHTAIDEMPLVRQLLFSPTTVLKRNGFQTTREGRANMRLLGRNKNDLSATAGSECDGGDDDDDHDDDEPAVETTPLAAYLRSGAARALKANNDPAAKSRRFQYHEALKTHDIVWAGLGTGEAGVGEKRDVDVYGGTGEQRTSKKKKK